MSVFLGAPGFETLGVGPVAVDQALPVGGAPGVELLFAPPLSAAPTEG